ncbi:MAG TPA: hypothetical protein VK252_00785 [Solirubrobacteraceae bacterium]|nr:hypothetical protein [Solirubrobacteraceae bacterium]
MSIDATTVFGLDVRADPPLSLLRGARAQATGRELDVEVDNLTVAGERDGFDMVCEQIEPNGKLSFRIEAHPQAGYLLWGPRYGAHLLSRDGRTLRCATADADKHAWQRLLVAQVLPFAAVLHGLEVFHASAVVVDRRAVAFVGPSRSGKTSVALELCRRGASFLADDVLALERDNWGLVGHPGSPLAGLDHAEAQRAHAGLAQSRIAGVNERELLVRMAPTLGPAPLGALFLLDRRADGPSRPCFEPAADARALLGATFNFVLADRRRLSGLLDVCALVAQRKVQRILMGPSVNATQVGAAVLARLEASG